MRESTLSLLRWTAQRANERVEDSKLGSIRPWRCYTNTRYIITRILIVRSRQWQHIWTISSRTKMVNPFLTRSRRSFSGERNCVRISTDFLSTRKMHSSLHFPSDWFVVLFSQSLPISCAAERVKRKRMHDWIVKDRLDYIIIMRNQNNPFTPHCWTSAMLPHFVFCVAVVTCSNRSSGKLRNVRLHYSDSLSGICVEWIQHVATCVSMLHWKTYVASDYTLTIFSQKLSRCRWFRPTQSPETQASVSQCPHVCTRACIHRAKYMPTHLNWNNRPLQCTPVLSYIREPDSQVFRAHCL